MKDFNIPQEEEKKIRKAIDDMLPDEEREKKSITHWENLVLHAMLFMCQESLDPENHKNFLKIYEYLCDVRGLWSISP